MATTLSVKTPDTSLLMRSAVGRFERASTRTAASTEKNQDKLVRAVLVSNPIEERKARTERFNCRMDVVTTAEKLLAGKFEGRIHSDEHSRCLYRRDILNTAKYETEYEDAVFAAQSGNHYPLQKLFIRTSKKLVSKALYPTKNLGF